MHLIPKPFSGLSLIYRNGKIERFDDILALLAAKGRYFVVNEIGLHFCQYEHTEYDVNDKGQIFVKARVYREYQCVLRDRENSPIDAREALEISHLNRRRFWRRYRPYYGGRGPVPWTGKGRWTGRYYRSPKTLRSKKQAQILDPQDIPVRAKRKSANLPCGWSDLRRSSSYERNWKRFRRHQWKEVA